MSIVISDFCSNHLADKRLIEHGIKLLASAGVDIVKFQSFSVDKLNVNFPNYIDNYEYYKSVQLELDDYRFIVEKSNEHNIESLFTIFDVSKIEFISKLGIEKVKIASPDANNYNLIKKCAQYFKTVFISTGMSNNAEINNLRKEVNKIKDVDFKLFYCVSKYPTLAKDVDFDKMQLFDGFSDHTLGVECAKKAIDLNIDYIEKHFTLGRDLPGRDQAMSTTLEEFKDIINYRNYKNKVEDYKIRWR